MSATHSSPSPNRSHVFTESYERVDAADARRQMNLLLFCLCLAIAALTFAGGVYSLLTLLRMRSKTSLCLIVASLSVDDLISLVPLSLFMSLQWKRDEAGRSGTVCTLSGLLYVFQGLSGNMKACVIVAYVFYVTKRPGARQGGGRPLRMLWAVAAVWSLSLALSALPLCGVGRFSPTPLGCLPEGGGAYAPLLFAAYSLCFCALLAFSAPLAYRLLCWTEPRTPLCPSWDGSVSLSRDSLEKSLGAYSECATPAERDGGGDARPSAVLFAQKRFSVILAMTRVVLWMPMMVHIVVSHAVQARSSWTETPSFFLTLLSAAVTPVFVLSERWVHLPCGCFINCRRDPGGERSAVNKRRFEFKLSFQQGYGVYKISQTKSPSTEKPSYSDLYSGPAAGPAGFSTTASGDSSPQRRPLLEAERPSGLPQSSAENQGFCLRSPSAPGRDGGDVNLDSSSVFDGPERRLSHEECRKIELTDWEWCRSKSERTPRQRSTGGLAIPLCAFQGTVSLQAPTGKTLSLSTYEVSSDGLKISPNAKKVEVYRSKSVGHEPNTEEPNSDNTDTNVKIHLEVLEICDNEEAMDSVSIVSNISQSSTHARSPSLRYSRRENRFVSCDLGETASYSLLIPTSSPDTDNINIHIPDTVEAHRQNSRRQHQESGGYREEIQLLNEAYRRQTENQDG
uniref:G-protein coupled receptors family 1 profile domain-containing protein n=1 Tax=Denticeps clupeoides TaxID=299321 RepID=A0AAY4CLK8_9TELE